MMIEDTERQIDLDIPENAEPSEVRVEDAPQVAAKPDAPQTPEEEGLEALKASKERLEKELQDERRARQQREAEAQQRQTEIERMRQDGVSAGFTHHLSQLEGAFKGQIAARDKAKDEYAKAMERGDFTAAADAQAAIAEATSQATYLANTYRSVEAQAKRGAPQPHEGRVPEQQPQPQQRQLPADPVEAMIVGANLSGRSAEWIRSHPEVATNPRLSAKVGYAHQDALAEGHTENSDAYFAHVDRVMGFSDDGGQPHQAAPQRRPALSAPVSPSAGGGRASPTTVRLTAEQREMAKVAGVSEEVYARNLLKIRAAEAAGTRH